MNFFNCRPVSWTRPLHWTGVAALALAATQAVAQEAPPVTVPPGANPLYLEWGITVAMIGLAAFAVCRKSNRT